MPDDSGSGECRAILEELELLCHAAQRSSKRYEIRAKQEDLAVLDDEGMQDVARGLHNRLGLEQIAVLLGELEKLFPAEAACHFSKEKVDLNRPPNGLVHWGLQGSSMFHWRGSDRIMPHHGYSTRGPECSLVIGGSSTKTRGGHRSLLHHNKFILAKLFNEAFKGYIGGNINFTADTLTKWLYDNFISLPLSHVFFSSDNPDKPIAFGLIAAHNARPRQSRLGAMGVVPACQGKGIGGRVLAAIILAECRRGTSMLELEVIQKNIRGVQMYTRAGFVIRRELLGWQRCSLTSTEFEQDSELKTCTFEDVHKLVIEQGASDLPWQAWGFVQNDRTHRAFQLGNAYCVVSNPEDDEKDTVRLQCLIVEPLSRGKGEARSLIKAMMSRYSTKKWAAGPIFPKEYGDKIAAALGFSEMEITQYQMQLKLD